MQKSDVSCSMDNVQKVHTLTKRILFFFIGRIFFFNEFKMSLKCFLPSIYSKILILVGQGIDLFYPPRVINLVCTETF